MKKVLLFLSVPIAAIVIAILALVLFVNPNQFKPMIIEQAKAQTGFDLVIDGDISWSFFPHLGFSIGKTQVLNPSQDFKQQQVVKFDEAALDISVLPLLEKQLNIGNVTLSGADIFIQKLKDGRSNLDIVKASAEQQAEQDPADQPQTENNEPVTPAAESPWKINLAGITVNNAKLMMLDASAGSNLTLSDVNFSLSQFSFDEWSNAEFNITGQNNQQHFSAAGKTEFKVSQDLANYELRSTEVQAKFKDASTDIQNVALTLESFQFDQPNNMTLAVKGNAADMNIDIKQAATLTVNKAITLVKLDGMTVTGKVDGKALPLSPLNIDMSSNVSFDLSKQYLDVVLKKLSANQLQFDGNAQVSLAPSIPKIVFDIHSPEINVDSLLEQMDKSAGGASKSEASKPAETAKAQPAATKTATAQSEPDLSATKNLDVTGKVTIDKLTASNAKLQNVQTQFKVDRGLIDLQKFAANLYQGSVLATAKIDARQATPSYTVHKEIKGVQVQPLLTDVAQMDFIAGTGNITADLNGKSLIVDKAKQNLAGVVKINFADGALYGVNVAHEVRTVQAMFKGQKAEADTVKKTDFSAFTATLNLSKGVMTTDNLAVKSPLLRVLGNGQANYVNETVDFLVKASVVGTLKGQEGKDTTELKNITLPIRIKGSWAEPKIMPDFNAALDEQTKEKVQKEVDRAKEKTQKELDRGLDKLLGEDDSKQKDDVKKAAGDLLNNLFSK